MSKNPNYKPSPEQVEAANEYLAAINWLIENYKHKGGSTITLGEIINEVAKLNPTTYSKIKNISTGKSNNISLNAIEGHLGRLLKFYRIETDTENGFRIKESDITRFPVNASTEYYDYYFVDESYKVSRGALKTVGEQADLKIIYNQKIVTYHGNVNRSKVSTHFSIHFITKTEENTAVQEVASFCAFEPEDQMERRFGVYASSGNTSSGKIVITKTNSESWESKLAIDIPDWVFRNIQRARLDYDRDGDIKHTFSSKSIEYRVFRYSNTENEVKEFTIKIDFARGLYIQEKGFFGHSNYKGFGEYSNDGIYGLLKYGSGSQVYHISFSIFTGGLNRKLGTIPEDPILPGMYQAVRNKGHDRIAGEMLLVRKDTELEVDEELNIKRYFNWQKNYLQIEGKTFGKSKDIRSYDSQYPSDFHHLIGVYRAWSYNRKGQIIQSKFEIKENYEAYLYSMIALDRNDPKSEGKQKCKFRISKFNNHNCLCVATYENVRRYNILTNFAIIEIPPRYSSSRLPMYMKAAYCNVGIEKTNINNHVFSGFIVFLKEEDKNMDIPIVKYLETDTEYKLLLSQKKYRDLKDKLDDLTKDNSFL